MPFRFINVLAKVDFINMTFDIDVLDCDLIFHGIGVKVCKRFNILEIIELIKGNQSSNKVIALKICEINPLLAEKENRKAEASFETIQNVFRQLNLFLF